MFLKKKLLIIVLTICPLIVACNDRTAIEKISDRNNLLGTICQITLYLPSDSEHDYKLYEQLIEQSFAIIADIEYRMTLRNDDSELAKLNRAEGNGYVSGELYALIKRALALARLSNGAFDPTIAPLVKAWGFAGGDFRLPQAEEINSLLSLVDYRHVLLSADDSRVSFARPGIQFDLGAIAKGYAAEKVARFIIDNAIATALINLGGNVQTVGNKADGEPWRVAIQSPRSARGDIIGQLEFWGNLSVVTSGDYERYYMIADKRYHHLLNPADGRPAESGLMSVTVVGQDAAAADALATACFVLGLDKAAVLIEGIDSMEAVFVDKNSNIHLTTGIKTDSTEADAPVFRHKNAEYKLIN